LEHHNWNSEDIKAYTIAKILDDIEKNNLNHAIDKGIRKGIVSP
jgi:hypothetical protein